MPLDRYWVYRSWGRINENIGRNTSKEFNELNEAIESFHKIFYEKTKNHFITKKFSKLPKNYFEVPSSSKPIDEPYKLVDSSTLHRSVQDLLKLLMNKEIMSGVMVKFNLDMNKMPLGKVRDKQICEANRVLKEIKEKIEKNDTNQLLIDSSNKFYSIIPHKASSKDAIVSKEDLVKKAEMLRDLDSIQFAYEFVYKSGESGENILDDFYAKLSTEIEPLHENAKQYEIIKEAFDSTKLNQNCYVQQIFKIQRKEEEEEGNYEMFNTLSNHRLLWHGSPIIRIIGILARGLEIAPAEATVTAGVLGKGSYFSDMVAKSIEYCNANQTDNVGVILLCEVALGNTIKCYEPENIVELPDGKYSAHGVGKTTPKSNKPFNNAIIYSGPPLNDENKTLTHSLITTNSLYTTLNKPN